MSAPVRGAFKTLQTVHKVVAQQQRTIVSGPPRFKVSMGEKAALGMVMVTAVCAPAAYVLANLDTYRGGKAE